MRSPKTRKNAKFPEDEKMKVFGAAVEAYDRYQIDGINS